MEKCYRSLSMNTTCQRGLVHSLLLQARKHLCTETTTHTDSKDEPEQQSSDQGRHAHWNVELSLRYAQDHVRRYCSFNHFHRTPTTPFGMIIKSHLQSFPNSRQLLVGLQQAFEIGRSKPCHWVPSITSVKSPNAASIVGARCCIIHCQ